MSGMDDLMPQTRQVAAGGRDLAVRVLRVRQYSAFTKAVAKPWPLIVAGEYLAAVTEYPDEVIAAVCAATDLEPAFVSELDGYEFLQLAAAVLELNLDFFARAALPAARKMAKAVSAAMMASSDSLPDSLPPDTATAPLKTTVLPN